MSPGTRATCFDAPFICKWSPISREVLYVSFTLCLTSSCVQRAPRSINSARKDRTHYICTVSTPGATLVKDEQRETPRKANPMLQRFGSFSPSSTPLGVAASVGASSSGLDAGGDGSVPLRCSPFGVAVVDSSGSSYSTESALQGQASTPKGGKKKDCLAEFAGKYTQTCPRMGGSATSTRET